MDRQATLTFPETTDATEEAYRLFRTLAVQLRSKGHKHYSARGIIHAIRFHHALQGPTDGPWKINDHRSTEFARRLASERPEFDGFFEFRRSPHEEK